ncbi:MAG: hypothetical protein KC643_30335 [Nitrospira sp.]|nr:hypothetical protein [Nitrospira sp.]
MGLPRILYDLREVGERAGKDWIAKITKRNRYVPIAITGSQASVTLSWERPESLAATVCDGQTSRVWVIDITSIRTYDGFPNLAVVTPA